MSQDAHSRFSDIPNQFNNSYENMYGMLKATIDRLAKKIDFVQKTPEIAYFAGHESGLPGRTWTPNS